MSSNENAPEGKRDFRQEVTDSIVRMLEDGAAPWQKPWTPDSSLQMPLNPTTGKSYRGGNAIHLMVTGMRNGYADPRWMTYKQASEKSWQVRKGEKGTQIEFWDVRQPSDKDEQPETDEKGRSRLIHRIYTVFNARQIDGVPVIEIRPRSAFEVCEAGEAILSNSGADIRHDQGDRAYYSRSHDRIHLPAKEVFNGAPAYYGTALHELSHWTGHPSRLNRPTLNESYRFGDLNYAKEELRAEIASCFMAAERGIPHNPEQHAAYVGSWIKALKDDKNEIFRAAADASAATDFILSLDKAQAIEKRDTQEGPHAERARVSQERRVPLRR